MTKITQKITQLPTPPTRTDIANFDTRADTFLPALVTLGTQANTWATQANQVATEIDQANTAAQSAKASAQSAATAAESVAGATAWAAGTAYAVGQCVYGSNGHTYRAVSASTGVNPATDTSGKWTRLSASVAAEEIAATASPDKIIRARADGLIDPSWMPAATSLDMRLAALGINPTLDLDFTRQRYRHYDAAQGGIVEHPLTPFVTFTRSSDASYFGPDGKVRIAPANKPRIGYDPLTGKCLGLVLEELSRNLLKNSETLATQAASVTSQAYTLSFYGSGKIVLSGAHSATLNSSGAFPRRTTLTFTPAAGTLTLTVTGECRYAQLETGAYATSWIPTTTQEATRDADAAIIEGTNVSSWYNDDAGAVLFNGGLLPGLYPGSSMRLFSIRNATTGDNFRSFFVYQAPRFTVTVSVGGGQSSIEAYQEVYNPENFTTVLSYKKNSMSAVMDGGRVVVVSNIILPSEINRIELGRLGSSGTTSKIERFLYMPLKITDTQLLELSK